MLGDVLFVGSRGFTLRLVGFLFVFWFSSPVSSHSFGPGCLSCRLFADRSKLIDAKSMRIDARRDYVVSCGFPLLLAAFLCVSFVFRFRAPGVYRSARQCLSSRLFAPQCLLISSRLFAATSQLIDAKSTLNDTSRYLVASRGFPFFLAGSPCVPLLLVASLGIVFLPMRV